MMGGGGFYRSGGQRITMDRATEIVEQFLSDRNDPDLEAAEIMELSTTFTWSLLKRVAASALLRRS